MSAQSVNATTYSHTFQFPGGTGAPAGFPIRDASDYTSRIKQTRIYQSMKGNIPKQRDYPTYQGNDVRIDYNFGAMFTAEGCSGCTGGANFSMLTVGN